MGPGEIEGDHAPGIKKMRSPAIPHAVKRTTFPSQTVPAPSQVSHNSPSSILARSLSSTPLYSCRVRWTSGDDGGDWDCRVGIGILVRIVPVPHRRVESIMWNLKRASRGVLGSGVCCGLIRSWWCIDRELYWWERQEASPRAAARIRTFPETLSKSSRELNCRRPQWGGEHCAGFREPHLDKRSLS